MQHILKSWDLRFLKYDFVWSSTFYHLCTIWVGHARNMGTSKCPLCQDHPSLFQSGIYSQTTPNLLQDVRTSIVNFPHQPAFPHLIFCVDQHHWTLGTYHHNTYTTLWMYCPLNVILLDVYTIWYLVFTLFGLKSPMLPPTPKMVHCLIYLLNDRTEEWWMKTQIAGWEKKRWEFEKK